MGQVSTCLLLLRIFIKSAMKAPFCLNFIVAFHFVLLVLLTQSCNAAVDLTIGVLSPWNTTLPDAYPFWTSRTLGAVSLAVKEINDAGILPDGKMLNFAYKDSDCDSKQASGSTVELQYSSTKLVSSYVAPPCSMPCRSVTDLTDFWHKPTMSWFCADTERTNDKNLLRTYTPFTSINNIATTTMNHFKWTSASIVFPSSTTWESLAFELRDNLKGNTIDVASYTGYNQPLTLDQAKEILRYVKTVSHDTERTNDKNLLRTYAPFTSINNIATTTMNHFKWTSASFVFPSSTTWESLAFELRDNLKGNTIDVASYTGYNQPLILDQAKEILRHVKTVSHVIWLIVGGITTLEPDEQLFMLAAQQLNMVNGGHVFLRIELYPDPGYTKPWMPSLVKEEDSGIGEDDIQVMMEKAFEALLLLTHRLPPGDIVMPFLDSVNEAFADLPNTNNTYPQDPKNIDEPASIMSTFLYDAIWLYALTLNYSVDDIGDSNEGIWDIFEDSNFTYTGMSGPVLLDSFGDRIYNFTLMDLQFPNSSAKFESVGYLSGLLPVLDMIPGESISWPENKVPQKPACGYQGEECLEQSIIIAIVVGALVTTAIIIIIPYISLKYRKFLTSRDWIMDMNALTFLPQQSSMAAIQGYPSTYRLPNVSNRISVHSLHSTSHSTSQKILETAKLNPLEHKTPEDMPAFLLATYASETVVLRKAKLDGSNLNKVLRHELKEMRWLVHDNVNRFLGICFPAKNSEFFYHISEYCTKGSLRSVLSNDEMALDLSFKMSFICDIAKGMQYLHNSSIKSHGILCSRLCFLDARWVTKISGFGTIAHQMFMEKNKKGADPEDRFEKMLWIAPEVLRSEMPPKGSQRGDVYSFGIMLHEILTRNLPYSEAGKTNKAIIRDVMKRKEPPYRPPLAELQGAAATETKLISELVGLMQQCWEELPEHRPDFSTVNHKLKSMQKGRKDMNVMDNMLSKMEKYTENLEKVVSDRTAQLLEEKSKTDELLYRMLPEAVADSLKKGEQYQGEFYDHVTLYFSDIVGFTSMSAESTPLQVVDLLNDLYTCFDAVIEQFDVYKVETIGDAYMCSSGLPRRNGNQHAPQIACMSLAIVEAVKTFKIRHLPERSCQIRIGINSGPVAAGVVGLKMPRFCLFGDTVNTASRMESNGLPQKIHVSSTTAALLLEFGGFVLEVRGQMKIKGKGVMNTFWLLGKEEDFEGEELQKRRISMSRAAKRISTDTMVSQDSGISPAATDSALPSGSMPSNGNATKDTSEVPSDSNTNNTNDARTSNGSSSNGPDMRARSISDVITGGGRSRMASIAEDAETTAKRESTLKHKNAINAMQQNGEQKSEGGSGDPHTSPRKLAITVPPQVTNVPRNPDSNQNTMNEIPVLPNVVIYSNNQSEGNRSESPFSYTVAGAKMIDIESSHSFVEVHDA